MFEGEEDHLIPSTSHLLLESGLFVVAGRMIGHSFLHDGPTLCGLSQLLCMSPAVDLQRKQQLNWRIVRTLMSEGLSSW